MEDGAKPRVWSDIRLNNAFLYNISGEADNAVISFSMSIAITAPAVVALTQFLRPVITAVKGLSINCDIDSMQGCPIWIYH